MAISSNKFYKPETSSALGNETNRLVYLVVVSKDTAKAMSVWMNEKIVS